MSEYIYRSNGEPLANERGEILLARAGEVVRCRDCKHYNTKLTDEYDGTSWCCIHAGYAFPYDYCAWAERRK